MLEILKVFPLDGILSRAKRHILSIISLILYGNHSSTKCSKTSQKSFLIIIIYYFGLNKLRKWRLDTYGVEKIQLEKFQNAVITPLRTYTSMFQKNLVRLQSMIECTYWLSNIFIFTESHYVSFETRFTEKNYSI